ncbi:MAG: hypothetical protein EOO10_20770 [Chitinophagaceae bacterium]|nr:MAG: hypothetical protein EOO10_20770 [Chitinophagaceae bacterium]
MRKWLVLLLLLILVGFCAFFFLLPPKKYIRQQEQVSFSSKAFSRGLFNEATWQQWWPGEKKDTTTFRYKGNTYSIGKKNLSSLLINICNGNDTLITELLAIPLTADSIELEWVGASRPSNNLFHQLQQSRWVEGLNSDIETLLQKMKTFYTQVDNVYPFKIREVKVVDSTLISTSATVDAYPTPTLVYGLLDKLKAYAKLQGANETGLPMLNITAKTNGNYLARVALPIDKKLPDTDEIQYRWMLGGGNIFVTEVKGGPHTIQQAFTTMDQYANDFNRVAPAIPFQSLVTDRRAEPDTARWITKVYWPVM